MKTIETMMFHSIVPNGKRLCVSAVIEKLTLKIQTKADMKKESLKQAPKQALRKADVSGSYIRIEIVNYFGNKKVIELKPYFDKQQLTEIDFLNAIRLLEQEKNKATYAFV